MRPRARPLLLPPAWASSPRRLAIPPASPEPTPTGASFLKCGDGRWFWAERRRWSLRKTTEMIKHVLPPAPPAFHRLISTNGAQLSEPVFKLTLKSPDLSHPRLLCATRRLEDPVNTRWWPLGSRGLSSEAVRILPFYGVRCSGVRFVHSIVRPSAAALEASGTGSKRNRTVGSLPRRPVSRHLGPPTPHAPTGGARPRVALAAGSVLPAKHPGFILEGPCAMARASPKRVLKRSVGWTLRGRGPVSGAHWECDRPFSVTDATCESEMLPSNHQTR